MKNLTIYILFIIGCSIAPMGFTFSQENIWLDKSNLKADPSINQETLSEVISTVEKAVNDYARYSSLFNKETRTVNTESVNRFMGLFDASTANMPKDYLFDSTATLYDINDYFIEVMEGPMKSTGIEVEIVNPVLAEVYRDIILSDQIVSKVVLTKIFKNYIQNGGTGYYFTPEQRRIIITYKTPTYYLEEALISSVAYVSEVSIPKVIAENQPSAIEIPVENEKCSLIDANSSLPTGVNENTILLIENLICKALDKYRSVGTLLDSTANIVTGTSASRFQQLFTSGSSLHLSDYREYPDNIPVATYREDVFKFFRNSGVQFELSNPRIKSISYDPDGFYFIKVLTEKEVPVYVDDETYDIKTSARKRVFELELNYLLVERTMSDPLLESAVSAIVLKPEEKRTILSFGPNLTMGLVSGTSKPGNPSVEVTNHTELGSTMGLGFQVDLISNFWAKHRASKKPLFFAIGLGLQTLSIEAEATDLEYEENKLSIDGIEGLHSRKIVSLKDQIPMKLLSLPFGIEYRLVTTENHKFELFLGGKIVPSFLLNSQSSFNAEGFYNLTYEQLGFSFYNENNEFQLKESDREGIDENYGIGTFNIDDNKGPELDGKFLTGYKVEASLLISISARFMLNARFGYGGYFGGLIEPSNNTPDFPLEEKPMPGFVVTRNTLFQDYYSDINFSNISIAFGLAYKLN